MALIYSNKSNIEALVMSNKIKRILQSHTKDQVDFETGEVKSSSTEKVINFPSEPPFVKLYLEDISKLYGLPKAGNDLLHCLLRKMDYEGIMTLVSTSKMRIAKELGLKVQTIDNNIQEMLKKDVLQRMGRGEFMFNPNIFAKGEWKDIYKQRNKYVEMKIVYKEDGTRTINGKVKDAADEEDSSSQ
jgi:hypothetical protein